MPVKIGRTVFESETMVKKVVDEDHAHEHKDYGKSSRNCEKCSPHQRSKSKLSLVRDDL